MRFCHEASKEIEQDPKYQHKEEGDHHELMMRVDMPSSDPYIKTGGKCTFHKIIHAYVRSWIIRNSG
jgi:hypothetical protein